MAELVGVVAALVAAGIKLADVITKLGKFLHDTKVDQDIKNDVEKLNEELLWMQAFLKDAENKSGRNNNLFKKWVDDVSKLVIRCVDVADEISLLTQKEPKTQSRCLNLRDMSCCCCCYMTSSSTTNLGSIRNPELSGKIKKLLSDIHSVSSRRERYDPNADAGSCSSSTRASKSEDGKLREQRREAPYANNENVKGLRETIDHLTTKLHDGDSGSFVISILGMGGLGKTTLARKLYNSVSPQYFKSLGWVCVSNEYNTQDILMSLINSMIKPSKGDRKVLTDISSMEAYLREYLSGRRFLVVVDDVWERLAWESLERAFPDNNNGSKVIITTRNEEVAILNNAYVHRLRYLDKDESWYLFVAKALPRGTECPSNLIQIGKEMVSKCSGLPLAIVVLGGVLLKKPPTFSKWRNVRDNLWKELEKGSVHINAILTLSFKYLPECLKPCFLYVAMFPEDFEISRSRLMLLWEAEGFITSEEEGCIGDAAKSYFDELVGRSLFSKTGGDWSRSTFRVHDLLRDLAIRKARETGFSLYYDGKGTLDVSKSPSHRRLAVFHPHNGIPVGYTNSFLHTICAGEVSRADSPCPSSLTLFHELFPKLHERFKMLRVLDIQLKIDPVPDTIGMLIHLRYLGVSFPLKYGVYELPDTIGDLKALQTLSIHFDQYVALPETVLKLTQLKHLIGRFELWSEEIGSLVCLETLWVGKGEQWCRLDTTKLVNLRCLTLDMGYIEDEVEAKLERFYDKFKSLVKLQTLTIFCHKRKVDIYLKKIFELCPSISHLVVQGRSGSLLGLDRFAVNLEVLEILGPGTDEEVRAIEKLPQLEALRLDYYYSGKSREPILFKQGFAQLRTLQIKVNNSLAVTVMEGCMPLLEHLWVDDLCKFQGPDTLMQLLKRC